MNGGFMKEKLKLIIKGAFIGIANIIPGVSGGTLAITMGIYEDLIGAISHFFKDLKKNINLLLFIGIGAVLAILLVSKLINYTLDAFPFATILFFIGLILGGMPMLFKKIKGETKKPVNWIILALTFGLVVGFTFLNGQSADVILTDMNLLGYIKLFFVGMIAAATMVIPGISGSFILMLIGYYEPLIKIISGLTDFSNLGSNLTILIPFGIGVVLGIVLIAKLIEYLLKHFEIKTYFGIIGFVIASIITIVMQVVGVSIAVPEILVGIILAVAGFAVAYKLDEQ